MVADSFQPLCVGGEASLPTRGADVRLDSIWLVLNGRVAGSRTFWSRSYLETVGYPPHAIDANGDLSSDMLQIIGATEAPYMEDVRARDASDVAKR
jgi:hypothetical protein